MHRSIRLATLAFLILAVATPVALADSTLRVFTTSSVKGELRDCGCKGKPLGGLAPRATMIADNTEGADGLLLVDGGNWSEIVGERALPRSLFMYEMMGELGYDAATVGDRELLFGRLVLDDMMTKAPGIQVVSANVTDKDDNLVFPPYTVIEKAGVKIGIIGATDDASYRFNLSRGVQDLDEFSFRDPRKSVEDILPKVREEADLIVLLAHVSAADAKQWSQSIEGIDVVVAGHDPGYAYTPERLGSTLLLRGSSQGKYLTILDLVLDDSKKIVDYNGEGLPVNKRIVLDPRIDAMLTAWEKEHGVHEADLKNSEQADDPVAGGGN